MRTSAISSEDRLEGADGGGCVIASMGLKYKSYCANVGRTFLIDPVKVSFCKRRMLVCARARTR